MALLEECTPLQTSTNGTRLGGSVQRLRNFLVRSPRPPRPLRAIGDAVRWQSLPLGSARLRTRHTPDSPYSYRELHCYCNQAELSERARGDPSKPSSHCGKLSRETLRRCLGGEFVIDPRTTLMQLWDALIWSLALVFGVLVPFEVAFFDLTLQRLGARHLLFNRCSDVIFIMDMLFQFFTMYFCFQTMRWIRRPRAIAMRYLHSLFLFDVFANVPIDIIHVFAATVARFAHGNITAESAFRALFFLRLLRLSRLNRLRMVYMTFRTKYGITSAQTQIPRFLVMCGYSSHILACAWGSTGRYGESSGAANTWVQGLKDVKGDSVLVSQSLRLYSRSLYWSVATVTSNGYGDIVPMSDLEYVVSTIGMMVAGFVWAYAIGTICGIIASIDQQTMEFDIQFDKLENMMSEQEFTPQLKRHIRRYHRRQAETTQMQQDLVLLRMMSPGLHARIARMQIGKWLEQVPYMKDIAESSHQVIMFIRSEVCSTCCNPKEVFDLPQALCLLRRGLALKAGRILCRGSVWGQCDVLLSNFELLDKDTPVSLTFSEVLHLPKRAFDKLEEYYPRARQRIRKARVRYAAFRMFLNIGRQELGRSFMPNRERADAVYAAQKESTVQNTIQRLQLNVEDLNGRMDEAIAQLDQLILASNHMHTTSTIAGRRTSMKDLFRSVTTRTRGSQRHLLHSSTLSVSDMSKSGRTRESLSGMEADDHSEVNSPLTVQESFNDGDDGVASPVDLDEALDYRYGLALKQYSAHNVHVVREASAFTVGAVAGPDPGSDDDQETATSADCSERAGEELPSIRLHDEVVTRSKSDWTPATSMQSWERTKLIKEMSTRHALSPFGFG